MVLDAQLVLHSLLPPSSNRGTLLFPATFLNPRSPFSPYNLALGSQPRLAFLPPLLVSRTSTGCRPSSLRSSSPNPSRSGSVISLDLRYGAYQQTVYYAKCFKDDVSKSVDILSDILQKSTFDTQAIERERDVILTEQIEVEKNIEELVFDHLHATGVLDDELERNGNSAWSQSYVRVCAMSFHRSSYHSRPG